MLGLVVCRGEMPCLPDGARFRTVFVSPGTGLRAKCAARAAARALRRDSVREAVFPEGYVFRDLFARAGITAVPLAPLYRATASALVRFRLAQLGIDPRHAAVTLAAGSVTPELRRAAKSLSADVRRIALAVPGGAALAGMLRRELGIAIQVGAAADLPRADLIVDFSGTAVKDGVLSLGETLPAIYDSPLPNALLSALWRSGVLVPEDLRVCDINLAK